VNDFQAAPTHEMHVGEPVSVAGSATRARRFR